jgi:hypothetical protein
LIGGTSISANGRFVVFASTATNLVGNDLNGSADTFIVDRVTGTVERVSVTSDGGEAPGSGGIGSMPTSAISDDGQIVAFSSYSNGLVPGDTNFQTYYGIPWQTVPDVFIRDRSTGETERVSVGPGDAEGNGRSGDRGGISLSGDGRIVAFMSSATNLVPNDTNGHPDVFVHDRQTGETSRVSISNSGVEAIEGASSMAMSADGRLVAFASSSDNLVDGDTNAGMDVFVHDRATGTTRRVSQGSDGTQFGSSGGYGVAISGDGCAVAFNSTGPDDGTGTTASGIYVHDCSTNQAKRVSADAANSVSISRNGRYIAYDGGPVTQTGTGGSVTIRVRLLELATNRVRNVDTGLGGTAPDGSSYSPAVSSDGNVVAYSSEASNLVLDDTNSAADVFAFDSTPGK